MKISKVYYEELRSLCVDGKWISKKIGAEVSVTKDVTPSESLYCAKMFVKEKLYMEMGYKEEIESNKRYKKAFEKVKKSMQNEVDKIEEDEIPF